MRLTVNDQGFATSAGFDKKQSQAAMQFAAFVKAEFEEAGPEVLRTNLAFLCCTGVLFHAPVTLKFAACSIGLPPLLASLSCTALCSDVLRSAAFVQHSGATSAQL